MKNFSKIMAVACAVVALNACNKAKDDILAKADQPNPQIDNTEASTKNISDNLSKPEVESLSASANDKPEDRIQNLDADSGAFEKSKGIILNLSQHDRDIIFNTRAFETIKITKDDKNQSVNGQFEKVVRAANSDKDMKRELFAIPASMIPGKSLVKNFFAKKSAAVAVLSKNQGLSVTCNKNVQLRPCVESMNSLLVANVKKGDLIADKVEFVADAKDETTLGTGQELEAHVDLLTINVLANKDPAKLKESLNKFAKKPAPPKPSTATPAAPKAKEDAPFVREPEIIVPAATPSPTPAVAKPAPTPSPTVTPAPAPSPTATPDAELNQKEDNNT